MFLPVVLVLCLVGFGFYFFVLRTLSGFAEQEIHAALSQRAKALYDICDYHFTDLMHSGQMDTARMVRIKKARTLGAIEDYAKRHDLGLVLHENHHTPLVHRIPARLVEKIAKVPPERAISTLHLNGVRHYLYHFTFKPWDWHFDLVSDTATYAPLINRVKTIYLITGLFLLAGLTIIIVSLEKVLRKPIRQIITAVDAKHPPDYQGIHEFEFLSRNIAGMMITLEKRTQWLERLYTIGTTHRGKLFFEHLAGSITDALGLSTVIMERQAGAGTHEIVTVAVPAGGQSLQRGDLANGLPCDHIIQSQSPVVAPTGGWAYFPDHPEIAASKAECYIGLAITGRQGQAFGCMHLIGTAREVSDWDMNFIKTASRMAGLEFELIQQEHEQKRIREQMFRVQKLESLGLLAGGVAHDFNNLLMGIQGRVSLVLEDTGTPPSLREHVLVIEKHVNQAAALSAQLLGFARGGKYNVKPTDINALLEQSAQMFGRTKKEIRIHMDFAPDLKPVAVDQRQVEQVFLNLFVNAWHAMPGGGHLYLNTENTILDPIAVMPHGVSAGEFVKISVTDTGTGMDPATLEKIFDPFFTTREMGRGTGLGLAMVYGIVTNHHGLILVDSTVGRGSTFTIYLPASNQKIFQEPARSISLQPGSETILLVDDEPMIIQVGQMMLAKLGYDVVTAGSGKEAVRLFAQQPEGIQLVIMDMIMPDMSGSETFDQLKAIRADVKVLLSSGYSLDNQAKAILQRGCKGFLQKPFSMSTLSTEIRNIIEKN